MPAKIPAKHNPFGSADAVGLLTITKDAEDTNEITIAIQAHDVNGRNCWQRVSFQYYLSDNAAGDGLTATAATTLADGAAGFQIPLVTGKAGRLVTDANGVTGLSITYTGGAKTWYLVCIMPDGSLVVSDAIVFAA